MNIVLIEDEKLVSEDLANILHSIDKNITVLRTISSVKEAIDYLKTNENPQLIFSDIHLGDGYSFEIFRELNITTPVIYCTAFNQHALQAFENNGIAYVLKPYSRVTISRALEKYQSLRKTFSISPTLDYDDLLAVITGNNTRIQTLLVNHTNKIIPVMISDVAYFTVEHKTTILATFQNQQYCINHSLDELKDICGPGFFRANRQFLVNRSSIKEITHYSFRKLFVQLSVDTPEKVIINKVKSSEFLKWLEG